MGLTSRLLGRTGAGRYEPGTIPGVPGPPPAGYRDPPGRTYDPGRDRHGGRPKPAGSRRGYGGPPKPTRTRPRRGLGRFLPHLFLAAGLGLAALRADLLPGSDGSASDVTDPYAAVAAEPGRTLVAQGVRFTLIGHRPLSEGACAAVPGCVTAASAHWAVTGTDLEARSWMFVFADAEAAGAGTSAVVADPGLIGEPRPVGWTATGGSPGRFFVLVRVGRPGGPDVAGDPVAAEAAEALRIYSTDPAVKELIEDSHAPPTPGRWVHSLFFQGFPDDGMSTEM